MILSRRSTVGESFGKSLIGVAIGISLILSLKLASAHSADAQVVPIGSLATTTSGQLAGLHQPSALEISLLGLSFTLFLWRTVRA